MNCWVHPEAETELGDAAFYYLSHASHVIAEAFVAEFARVCDMLIENQRSGSLGEHGMRVYHFHRFPYSVIYAEDATLGPQIFAIAHQRHKPGYWSGRF